MTATIAHARQGLRAAPVDRDVLIAATEDHFAAVPSFQDWIYNTIRPYLHGLILEIGGSNSFSQRLLDDGHEVYLSDHRIRNCHALRRKFGLLSHCRGVLPLDLAEAGFDANYSQLFGQFGAVLACNALQRMADDQRAVANAYKLLRPGGHLIAVTPAYPMLFGRVDRNLGNLRRYSANHLRELFYQNGLDTVRSMHLNLAGLLGWWLPGVVPRDGLPTPQQLVLWNRLVHYTRRLDGLLFHRVGLTILTVGRARPAHCHACVA
jgi:SAM-dependent methyltransferase